MLEVGKHVELAEGPRRKTIALPCLEEGGHSS